MNKIIRFFILAALVSLYGMVTVSCEDESRKHVLKIYNWADYIGEGVLEDFQEWYKEETGEEIEIIYQLFDINEVMLSKIEKGHEDFDVVCPSEYIIERMLRNDLLLPIDRDFGKTPDYTVNISPFIQGLLNKVDGHGKDANDYTVAYMWGTTGYLYNPKYVTAEEISSWGSLRNPKLKGKLYVKDAFRDVYSSLLTYIYKDELANGTKELDSLMYDSSDESIEKVETFLKSIKDNVSGWEADFGKEQMTKEKAWVNVSWSGDAQWAIDEAADVGVTLDYFVPEEGSNVWFDGWVIPKYAKNVKAARYFINFLCRPDIALRNMDEIGYVSVISTSEILENQIDEESYEPLDASFFFGEGADSVCVSPVQYFGSDVISKCAMMHDSGERTEKLLSMWSRVKGDNANSFTYIILIVAAAALLFFGIRRKQKRHRRKQMF
ncbi:MAG: ABC transporter substrate-binding protein [Bacteroidaceae bacterium]|nr:ABC transporter substrate-binding protein [Bacteroidaceae bacterium]